jgi:hypothetical protein
MNHKTPSTSDITHAPPLRLSGTPIYSDNFDGANDTTALKARGYKVYYRGAGPQGIAAVWFQGNPAVFVAYNGPSNGYVGSNYETVTGANDIDNWLVLPAQNILTDDSLYFYQRSPTASSYPDTIRVMYSAAGDSVPEAGTWIELGRFKTTTSGSWERKGFRAPSPGAAARFAIRYAVADGGTGNNSDYIGIDALTIERQGILNDVNVVANLAPTGNIQRSTTTVAPKASINNSGSLNQTTPFNVTYMISPGGYSSTRSITLSSGATVTVTFDSTFVLNTVGTYNVTIFTSLGSDQIRSNDTLRTTFTISENNFGGGGPNSGGYYFANSVAVGAPSRPTYGWVDPVASGHTMAVFPDPDDGVVSVDIGFNFTFFGTTYTAGTNNLNIYTNGFLNLGAPVAANVFGVTAIPDAFNPPNLIAACLLDLDFTAASYPAAKVYYGGNANQFVVTFFHGYRWVSGGTSTDYITFQTIFYPNGNIKMQYNDVESVVPPTVFTSQGDIGIQNALGTFGIQFLVNGTGGPMFGSPLAIEYGTNPNSLPIQLAFFRAGPLSNGVRLDWRTISETNNYGFFVQRRPAGEETFTTVSPLIPGHGTTLEPHDYSFVDNSVPPSGTFQYRLRHMDFDGTIHHTEPISITLGPTFVSDIAPLRFALFQNYPNPFNPETQIRFSVENTSKATLRVYNLIGQEVATLFDGVAEAGRYYDVKFSGANLTSGVYFYKLTSGKNSSLKRLMLLK